MQRLDKLLVEKGLAQSRTQAQKLVEEGLVEQQTAEAWHVCTKASLKVAIETSLRVGDHPDMRYVSRAGLKLEAALKTSQLSVDGMHAIDIGQSTGGFTDCLLQHNASHVVGIEVGKAQLVNALRQDPRVSCLEGINARHLTPSVLPNPKQRFDIAVMDVSFISQKLILPNIPQMLKANGYLISLIKPQFEVGPDNLGKGGIVKDDHLLNGLKAEFVALAETLNFNVIDYRESPIKGGDGNTEFLLVAKYSSSTK